MALATCTVDALASDFIPELKSHDKPHPFYVVPLYDLVNAGGEMPYVQNKVDPVLGVIESVAGSMRPVRVGSSYNSATDGHETFVDARLKLPLFFMRAIASTESADDYETASGDDQRFGYDRDTLQFVAGVTPIPERNVKLIYINDSIEDHKAPLPQPTPFDMGSLVVMRGVGQDPIDTDREIMKLMWDEQFNHGIVKNLHAELFSMEFDRIANNFELRPSTPPPQHNQAVVDRTNEGVKVDTDLHLGGSHLNLAMTYKQIRHDAQRFGGPMVPGGLDTVSAYQYPGIELDELLLSGTSEWDLADAQKLTFGLSWKQVDADATKAGLNATVPGAGIPSSLDLYKTYYGDDVEVAQKDSHWNGKLQWDYQPEEGGLSGYASLGHFYRSPDTQERYFAAQSFNTMLNSPMGTSARGVGNPELDWELHRRLEAGLTKQSDNWIAYGRKAGRGTAWQFQTKAYYDDVHDFISRDRAHGQTETGVNDSARIWRNVDAELYGLELDLQANLSKGLAGRLNLQAIRGKNTSDDRDLYGIAPVEANMFLDYFGYMGSGGTWNVGGRLRHVAEQTRVDDDPTTGSGYDAGETDSFTVLDLYAGMQFRDRVGIRFGVNNVTDEAYSESDADFQLEGTPYLIEAPGRHYYVSLVASF
ncbi:MAG: TonB-dependent receptor [Chromatiales bacterium]|nr:TonB-dependent receptor [Chromatiales bacterium]